MKRRHRGCQARRVLNRPRVLELDRLHRLPASSLASVWRVDFGTNSVKSLIRLNRFELKTLTYVNSCKLDSHVVSKSAFCLSCWLGILFEFAF